MMACWVVKITNQEKVYIEGRLFTSLSFQGTDCLTLAHLIFPEVKNISNESFK